LISIDMTQAQRALLSRTIEEGIFGDSAPEVLKRALAAHSKHVESGGSPYAVAGRRILESKMPSYSKMKYDTRVGPATGKAIPVHRGEVLRISQTVGGQCVDFNAYNLDDYKEYLDCGMNRLRGVDTGQGTIVWTGSPRARPMYAILSMPDTCDQYYGGHRCNGLMYEAEYGLPDHPNCQDSFAEAIREYGLTPDDVHDSYNFWMKATLDSEGRRVFPWNRGQADDHVDLLAFFDTLAVPVACGGDLASVNSFRPSSITAAVFEETAETMALVDRVNSELASYQTQKTPDDFVLSQVRATRRLERDPTYKANFRSLGPMFTVEVEIDDSEAALIEGLMKRGIYGATAERCIVASFCRWYETNRIPNRHVSLRFAS
jgi:uncharacterized protein YcgI (DUF1989 family)